MILARDARIRRGVEAARRSRRQHDRVRHLSDVEPQQSPRRDRAGENRKQAAVEPLLSVLSDPDPDMRACAALSLGRVGEGQAAPTLTVLLTDESAFVASIAADALAMIGQPAVEPLAKMLAEESSHARLLAVRALGHIGTQNAIAPLFGALQDPSYLVRYYAQEALEALGVGMVFLKP